MAKAWIHVALAMKVFGGGLGVLGGEVVVGATGGGGRRRRPQSSVRGGWRAWRVADVCFPDGSQPAVGCYSAVVAFTRNLHL